MRNSRPKLFSVPRVSVRRWLGGLTHHRAHLLNSATFVPSYSQYATDVPAWKRLGRPDPMRPRAHSELPAFLRRQAE